MSGVGQPERATQNRVIALLRDELGYRYLGDWSDRPSNSNIQEDLLTAYLTKAGYGPEQINRAIYLLRTEADNPTRNLYENNKVVYSMLRYGVPVKIEAGRVTETVKLIHWAQPEKNDFAIAEEVTLRGGHERRPDLVLYVNGVAVAVIELKNSHTSIGAGIRQVLSNQQKEFNEWFFTTVQIVFAGNDSEGLRYGTIKTEAKYFLKWKENEIGFTGTPLLKEDKATSLEVFGGYIHTYKFNEGVEDGVVLDLVYEARDIEQSLGSQEKIDAWFEAKTRALNDWQKAALREQRGTMQKVLSSRSRMERVVSDIVFDFSVKLRLSSERGNALLVASSIYEACKYFESFNKTVFKGKCAVVTSYNPQAHDVTLEETGANTETEKQFLYNTYTALLKDVDAKPGKTRTETYEDAVKELFKTQPANMRLPIVVDKLLTGFDAPSCTYLYIDKSMQDHGLFQAICRTNRLDGEDKPFGYIVDYKDLFKKVQGAIAVYTSELDSSDGAGSPEVLMQDRLKKGRERLDHALEAIALLCDPVQPPKDMLAHIHYFCGNSEIADDLKEHEPQRVALYQSTAALVRAYANIADDLPLAGYTEDRIAQIKHRVNDCVKVRDAIRQAANETIDLKAYEADMRHLIDTYIEAEEPRRISQFGEIGLLDLIVKSGLADAINSLPPGIKGDRRAVAETIANNVRSKIIKEHLNDPALYDKMSALLGEILADLKAARISYEEFLKRIADLARTVHAGTAADTPETLNTPGKRALYNNLMTIHTPSGGGVAREDSQQYGSEAAARALHLAVQIDEMVRRVRPNSFRGSQAKENVIKAALLPLLGHDTAEVERIFLIIKAQSEY